MAWLFGFHFVKFQNCTCNDSKTRYAGCMEKGVDHVGNAVVYFCHDGAGNFLLSKRGVNCRDEQAPGILVEGQLSLAKKYLKH